MSMETELRLQTINSFYNTFRNLDIINQEALEAVNILNDNDISYKELTHEELTQVISTAIYKLDMHLNHLKYLADQTEQTPAIDK